jgi:hypothetical protein
MKIFSEKQLLNPLPRIVTRRISARIVLHVLYVHNISSWVTTGECRFFWKGCGISPPPPTISSISELTIFSGLQLLSNTIAYSVC